MAKKSTLKVPYRGVIEIVGDHDTGKTLAALQTVSDFKSTVFVDDDVKGDGTVRQLDEAGIAFGEYINLGAMRTELGATPTPEELLKQLVIPTVDRIADGKHDLVVWDTWRIVYQSARGYVERNQTEFKDVVTFRGSSPIIQGLISKVARMIEQTQLNKLRNACQLLVITHHMKDHYASGVAVGRIPESSATFAEVSNMRLWLRRNTQAAVPIMLFLKRPNLPIVKNGKVEFVNVVPMKITPEQSDKSVWDAIARYEDKPIGNRAPTPEETPTDDEWAIIKGTLSDEQRTFMMEVLKHQKETEELFEQPSAGTKENGNSPTSGNQFIAMANKLYGLTLADIKSITGKSLSELKAQKSLDKDWQLVVNFVQERDG